MPNRRQLLIAGLGAILLCASLAAAQQIFVGGGRGFAPRFAKLEDFDGSFLYCRAFYQGGWTTPTIPVPTTTSPFDWRS